MSGCPRIFLNVLFNILLHYIAKIKTTKIADLRELIYLSFIFSWISQKLIFEGHVTFIPNRYKCDFFFSLFLNLFPSLLKSSTYFNLELLETWSGKLQNVIKTISFLHLTHLNASSLQVQRGLVVLIEVYNALDIQISFMPSICYADLQTLYITWFIYINTAFTNRTYRNRCIR